MSEDTTQAENEAVDEPTTEDATPATEEQTTQEQATDEVETQVEETTENEAPESKPKHNAESRIKSLVKERNDLRSKVISQDEQPSRGSSTFSDQFAGKDNVSPDDLNRAAEQYVGQAANSIVDQRLNPLLQEIQRDRLDNDIALVQQSYPELDPESESYDSKLDQVIADNYNEFGTSVRLKDFVAKQMKLTSANSERAAANQEATVSKQAEETAVRPGSTPKATKEFKDKTIEEMEAELGTVR